MHGLLGYLRKAARFRKAMRAQVAQVAEVKAGYLVKPLPACAGEATGRMRHCNGCMMWVRPDVDGRCRWCGKEEWSPWT